MKAVDRANIDAVSVLTFNAIFSYDKCHGLFYSVRSGLNKELACYYINNHEDIVIHSWFPVVLLTFNDLGRQYFP